MRKEKEADKERDLAGVDLVVFDVDNTIVKPTDPSFYKQYSLAVDRAVAKYLDVDVVEGNRVANLYREKFGGGERAIFRGDIPLFFPEYAKTSVDFNILYDEMCKIDPSGQFENNPEINRMFLKLRNQNIKVVALTDSPTDLSRKVLKLFGIDPDNEFDEYLTYERSVGPLKILQGKNVFNYILKRHGVRPSMGLSVGDTVKSDIDPAKDVGMKTCLISVGKSPYDGLRSESVLHLVDDFKKYYG